MAGAGLLFLLLAFLPGISQGAAAQVDNAAGIRAVGTFPRIPDDVRAVFGEKIVPPGFDLPLNSPDRPNDVRFVSAGTMIVFPDVRQMWQLYPYDDAAGFDRTAVAVRDLDSMALKHTFEVEAELMRGQAGANAQWWHAVQPGKRVFLSANTGTEVIEVDFATFEQRRYPFSLAGGGIATQFPFRFAGFSYDPHDGPEGALIAIFAGVNNFAVANVNTLVQKLDVATRTSSNPRHVRACNGALTAAEGLAGTAYQAEILAAPEHVYITCQRSGNSAEVVRIARGDLYTNGSPEQAVVGPTGLEGNFVDPRSGRIHVLTTGGEDWVFDTASMSFIGVVAGKADEKAATAMAFGFDRETGRVFFRSVSSGFGVAEGRYFPVPQARTVRRDRTQAHEVIYFDPKTSRAFQLDGYTSEKHHRYTIFQIDPAPTPPQAPDPDANTIDMPEKPGVTDARYFANASGYGVRAVIAKGVVAAPPSPSFGGLSAMPLITSQYVNSRCGYTDRELVAGQVSKAEYDTGSTAAEAIAVGIDDRTKVDLDRPSRCDLYGRDPNGNEQFTGIFGTAPDDFDPRPGEEERLNADEATTGSDRWGRTPASCSSSEGGESEVGKGQDPPPPAPRFGSSEVSCPNPGQVMEAFAESKLEGQLTVGHAWTRTKLWRDGQGVHARTESVAKNLDIAGIVTIGEIRSVAESISNGRPNKEAMSSHHIEISRVSVAGVTLCTTCVPSEVVANLNAVLVGRAQFRVAEGLDERLKKGTPKGALTAIQKSVERQVSDQALIGDFTNAVPAFEILIYNDHYYWGRARQLYQFAGVSTVATYNVTMQPTGLGGDDTVVDEEAGTDEGAVDGELGAELGLDGSTASSEGDGGGGLLDTIRDIAQALLRGIRLFFTNPRQAMLLLTAWALLLLPGYLARRRRLLTVSLDG